MKLISILVPLILLISTAASQNQPAGPGENLAKMMKRGETYATPGAPHHFLKLLSGKWKTASVVMDIETQFGSSANKMILGDRFLEMNYEGEFLGLDLKGKITLGYDNYKHKFTVVYIDNLNTSIRTAEGMLNTAGTVLSLWGTMDEWLTDEHDKPVMYRYKILDQNTFLFEVHDLSLALGNTRVIEVTYTKQ
jgi:hypothetical protein